MSDLLARMVHSSRSRASRARAKESDASLRRRALDSPTPPPLELHPDGFDLIAEIKRRSPSAGRFEDGNDASATARALQRARAYAAAGAAAISVLTEPIEFGGKLTDLSAVAREVALPVMRKDFLVDPYQLLEARAAGASGALLILRMLTNARLRELIDAADEMGLFVLLEAFDGEDLERARPFLDSAGSRQAPILLGLNCRDLKTLLVEPDRLLELRDQFPQQVTAVAESGLGGSKEVATVSRAGYSVALVGGALMLAADPQALATRMIEAGRAEVARRCV